MSRIRVVLFRSIYPRNVGMCARSMANMGVEKLILVGPQTELTDEAKQGAAHAQAILKNARIYKTNTEFLANEGEGVRIALSGKDGRLKAPDWLDQTLQSIAADGPGHSFFNREAPVYLIFGPEDDGLSFEEMDLCHHVCRLPTFGEITSLNLSHAVLLTCYLVQTALGVKAGGVDKAATNVDPKEQPAYYPSETIRQWLETLGFDLSARRVNIEKTLNRIFLSRCPTPEELRTIDSVLQQTIRKLRG